MRTMPLRFTQRILDHLQHRRYEPVDEDQLAREMRIDEEDLDVFDAAVRRLADAGELEIDDKGRVRLPSMGDEVEGTIKVNARGFGFLIPDRPTREGDLFIPPGRLGDAITGDRVRARVRRDTRRRGRGDDSRVGEVIQVIERGQSHFVGVLQHDAGQWFVEPDGNSLHDPVLIRDPHAKGAKAGDKVVIELMHRPEGRYVAEGVITQVLGEAGRPDVETQAVITAHGLPDVFESHVLDDARKAARAFDPEDPDTWGEREDLRDTFTVTIDPPDARDYDDAITIERADGRWTLGVHIADVATFVERNAPLDEEARERGNSVYLPRLVIPMLPEILSNGVCSLQEGVPRLAKSAFIEFDDRGNVKAQRLANTVIRSNKRLTYLEAQALIDGDPDEARKHAKTDTEYTDELITTLKQCDELARILRKRRLRDGMIVLNLPEVELVFDEEGHVVDAVPEDDAFTHTVIEMFMVEANEAVARVFDDLGVPILRRVHPEPATGDLEELQMYARAVGIKVPERPERKDLQRLLDATRHTPAARAIHFAVLRTLTKAKYSPAMIGHFALASDHYAHFTSPIRRYPDLAVHRATQSYLERTDNGRNVPKGKKRRQLGEKILNDPRVMDEGELIDLGRHCSDREKAAQSAERELRDFLVMQFLQEKHMGAEFPGVVTGVLSSGVFVSIEKFLVEGMVRSADLPQPGGKADRWNLNEQTGRLVAQRSGASLGIGDIVTVKISRIDLGSRHMDLLLTKMPDRETKAFTGRRGKSKPGEPKKTSRAKGPRGRGKSGKGKGRKSSKQGPKKTAKERS